MLPRPGQSVWITDELLADSFHRFVNASNANRSTCKRYGSNVPGPLEAKRRLAKRRMMGLAASGGVAGPSFGALFGLNGPARQPWTWEPPKPAKQSLEPAPSEPTPLPQWLSSFEQPPPEDEATQQPPLEDDAIPPIDFVERYLQRLESIRDVEELGNVWLEASGNPQNTVLLSQLACMHFIETGRHTGFQDLFHFLRNPRVNVPEAENMKTFLTFAKLEPLSPGDLKWLLGTIRTLLSLGAMVDSELLFVVDAIGHVCRNTYSDPFEASSWLVGAYRAIWDGISQCKIRSVDKLDKAIAQKIAKDLAILPCPPAATNRKTLDNFRKEPHKDPAVFRFNVYRHAWPPSYFVKEGNFASYLASWVTELNESVLENGATSSGLSWDAISSFLESLGSVRAPKVITRTARYLVSGRKRARPDNESGKLLNSWYACASRTSSMSTETKVDLFASDRYLAFRMDPLVAAPWLETLEPVEVCSVWLHRWLPLCIARENSQLKPWSSRNKIKRGYMEHVGRVSFDPHKPYSHTPFFWIIRDLVKHDMPYNGAVSQAAHLILRLYGPMALYEFFKKLCNESIPIEDPRPFAPVVEKLSDENPVLALKMYRRIPRLWLSMCPKLPIALIRDGCMSREALFAMLKKRDVARKTNEKGGTDIDPGLKRLHDELIHLVAFAFADQNLSASQRFRNVYYCYIYLSDRQAVMRPLISKAFVRAAITKSLENKEWVSTVKLRWILRLVRRLEGSDVADTLDSLIWQWRGNVIMDARERWDRAGFRRPSTVTMARKVGLFDHDYPRQQRHRGIRTGKEGYVEKLLRLRAWGRLAKDRSLIKSEEDLERVSDSE
ncbi:uncharacterized protein K452DRAFT_316671 [Aplosporella prunicola CBS 121167]|uniref:Uncharacterized protein n=1 Tax=Aplosporella prunicola CBS 121167 TaxID=1176127 RepID=A0A6A6BKW1_9PEZI|nr:uncharacterized protein K452DRAFT_316671 [Aplosporella prunicola CBS 121167]KAF2144739.1 hypothetical protein K452DRAFT_316671 [Aplosporella prunicola CBS 121167]